ncbi:cysteine desulfurase [Candidatus Bathyarchaeota archaeon]|nr:cysteine desulfurase [Candidatus Bathyarchaeota archaeon]
MKPYLTENDGNASSSHAPGQKARSVLEESRETVAKLMGAPAEELIFTGSATESNNLVTKGHAFHTGRKKTHLAVTTVEHECVLNSAKWLKTRGYKVTFLPVDQYGILEMEKLEETLKKGVSLVSVIHGNNEIGTINSLKEIGKICHQYGALFHSDAAQSFGKIPISVNDMNLDLVTVNAHKLYGPKGVGALYIRKDAGIQIDPLLHGGGHEFGLRASTENVPGIVGFAKAVEMRRLEMNDEARDQVHMRDALISNVLKINDSYLNGHPSKRLPNNTNFRFSYIDGEAVVTALDAEGIYASSGSACSSRSIEPSHVLLGIGLNPVAARGSLRISLGKYNTDADINYISDVLPGIVKRLRKMSPLTPKS